MNLGQFLSGAGVVSEGIRQTEEAERVARGNQLKIEEQNRLNQFRQEMLRAPMPTAPGAPQIPTTKFGELGILPVEYIEPPAIPAAPGAPAAPAGPANLPEIQVTRPLPFGQDVPNPSGSERASKNAQELVRMREMRVADVKRGLDQIATRTDVPPRMVANQRELLAREQQLLDAARQGLASVSPTVPFGIEGRGRAAPPPEFASLYAAVERVESGGQADAVSPKGALGPMQTMPKTLVNPGFGVAPAKDNSPAEQRRVGQDYLAAMLRRYGGNLDYSLAAYNWGPGNTDKWIAKGADMAKLPKETREYIPKVKLALGQTATLAVAAAAPAAPAAPEAGGLNIPGISSAQAAEPPRPEKIEVSGTSSNYLANPQSISVDMQRAQQMRGEVERLAGMYQRSGMGAQFMETRMKLIELDNNMIYLHGMQGIQEFSTANDPRRLSAVWSQYAGVPIGIQLRTDNKFNIIVNGKKTKEGVSASEIVDTARSAFDQTYRQQKSAASAEYNKESFKAQLKMQENQGKEVAQMIREIAVERIKGSNAQALEWAKANFGWDIKPTGSGDGTVIIRPPGAAPYLFNPSGKTIEIDGVKVQSNAAYPIAGLPTYGGVQMR